MNLHKTCLELARARCLFQDFQSHLTLGCLLEARPVPPTRKGYGLFRTAVEGSEEAILNALFTAETTRGRDGHIMPSLPIPEVLMILRRHGVDVRSEPG